MKPSLKHIFFSVWVLLGLLSLASSQEKACSSNKNCLRNQVCLRVGGEKKCVKKGTCTRACGKGSRCRLSSSKRVVCTKCPAGSQLVLKRCIKTDLWSAWGPWSSCSVTCGSGTEERKRSCENSACPCSCTGIGNSTELRSCHAPFSFCEYGKWTAWESWSECSNSHGGCNRTRVRNCEGGLKCEGNEEVVEECNASKCPEWGEWSAWSECSASCNGGLKNRNRSCSGDICKGKNEDIELCNNIPCSGSWGTWGPWGVCSGEEEIRRSRTRSCSNGDFCEGNGEDNIPCVCDLGWTFSPETKRCYIVLLDKRRIWSEARAECRNRGGDLATILSKEENEFVLALAGGTEASKNVWIGPTGSKGTYRNYADDGSNYVHDGVHVCMRQSHVSADDRGFWFTCGTFTYMNAVCKSDPKQ